MQFDPIALLLWLMNQPVGPSVVMLLTIFLVFRVAIRRIA